MYIYCHNTFIIMKTMINPGVAVITVVVGSAVVVVSILVVASGVVVVCTVVGTVVVVGSVLVVKTAKAVCSSFRCCCHRNNYTSRDVIFAM